MVRRLSDLDEDTRRAIQRKVDLADKQYTKRSRWLTVRTATILLKAIKSRKTWVVLDGRAYTITYDKEGKAWVAPEIGIVPCGRYTEKLLESIIQAGEE